MIASLERKHVRDIPVWTNQAIKGRSSDGNWKPRSRQKVQTCFSGLLMHAGQNVDRKHLSSAAQITLQRIVPTGFQPSNQAVRNHEQQKAQ